MDKLEQLKNKLESADIPDEEIDKIIFFLGREKYVKAKKTIEKFLNHKNRGIRNAALSTLVFKFVIDKHAATCKKFMLHDTDEYNRALGASGLGMLLVKTNNKNAIKSLLQVFLNKRETRYVRDTAYDSILHIQGIPFEDRPKLPSKLDYKDFTYMSYLK